MSLKDDVYRTSVIRLPAAFQEVRMGTSAHGSEVALWAAFPWDSSDGCLSHKIEYQNINHTYVYIFIYCMYIEYVYIYI